MLANGGRDITLILLTWTIWRAPTNASKWRMGFNSAFKGLIYARVYISVCHLRNLKDKVAYVILGLLRHRTKKNAFKYVSVHFMSLFSQKVILL